jgi:hypothetical protein
MIYIIDTLLPTLEPGHILWPSDPVDPVTQSLNPSQFGKLMATSDSAHCPLTNCYFKQWKNIDWMSSESLLLRDVTSKHIKACYSTNYRTQCIDTVHIVHIKKCKYCPFTS